MKDKATNRDSQQGKGPFLTHGQARTTAAAATMVSEGMSTYFWRANCAESLSQMRAGIGTTMATMHYSYWSASAYLRWRAMIETVV